MIYFIEYTYDEEHPKLPKANGFFHFVKADNEDQAIIQAKDYIHHLLFYRFGRAVTFEIKSVELIK